MQVHAVSFVGKVSIAFAPVWPKRSRSKSLGFGFQAISVTALIACAAAISSGQTTATTGDGWVVLPVSEYAALRHAEIWHQVKRG